MSTLLLNEIRDDARRPDRRRPLESRPAPLSPVQEFFKTRVLPALHEMKVMLEVQGKIVEVHHATTAQINVSDKKNPHLVQFMYIVAADETDGSAYANIFYYRGRGPMYEENRSDIKPGATIGNVTREDIVADFTREFQKVRDELA